MTPAWIAVVVIAELYTERLRLRRWQHSDSRPFADLNADPAVMEYYPAPLTRAESAAMAARIEETFDVRGFGLWAVEVRASGVFAGYVGLSPATFGAHFTPAVEIGWRLARSQWGRGDAIEAARVATADGFDRLGLEEIVSFTSAINRRSRRVMEKLGMTHDAVDDFDHPVCRKDIVCDTTFSTGWPDRTNNEPCPRNCRESGALVCQS